MGRTPLALALFLKPAGSRDNPALVSTAWSTSLTSRIAEIRLGDGGIARSPPFSGELLMIPSKSTLKKKLPHFFSLNVFNAHIGARELLAKMRNDTRQPGETMEREEGNGLAGETAAMVGMQEIWTALETLRNQNPEAAKDMEKVLGMLFSVLIGLMLNATPQAAPSCKHTAGSNENGKGINGCDKQGHGRARFTRLELDDETILGWFGRVELTTWLTPLQVFWCIGKVDENSLMACGQAMSLRDLDAVFEKLKQAGKMGKLPVSITNIRDSMTDLENGLFDRTPFFDEAWNADEAEPTLRMPLEKAWRGSKWTPRGKKAWQYADRFLEIRGLTPYLDLRDNESVR